MKKTLIATALLSLFSVNAAAQSLEEAVAAALDSHPDVREAFTRYKTREAEVKIARAGYLPSLDANAGYGYEKTKTDRGANDELARRELGLSLVQPLFEGFATSSEVARTSAERDADRFALLAKADEIALSVSELYSSVLASQQLEQLARENLEAHQQIHDQIRKRTEAGVASTSDLSQINARLALARSNMVAAVNNRIDLDSRFLAVVNERPEALVLPQPDRSLLPGSLDEALKIGRDNHPGLKSAAMDVEAAKEARERAKSNNYPRLSLELGQKWDNNIDGVKGANEETQAMLRLRYNLFSGGADRARTEAAAQQMGSAEEINSRAHRQLEEGIRLSWAGYELVGEQLNYLREHVESAMATRNAYQKQFDLGKRSLLDLLDAENELFESRRAFVSGERDFTLSQYRILNATGRLLQSMHVRLPASYQQEG